MVSIKTGGLGMFYLVIKEHIRSYDETLCLKAGEVVR